MASSAGSQDFDIAVIQHPSQEGLAHLHVIDLIQRRIGVVLMRSDKFSAPHSADWSL